MISVTDAMGEYHSVYEQRRQCSTMAEVAREVITKNLVEFCACLDPIEPLRILSVGCGDGNLDLPVLEALSEYGPVEYLGLDVNGVSLASFASDLALRSPEFLGQVQTELRNEPVEDFVEGSGTFHVVLLAHVLYYSPDPAALVRALQRGRLTPDGIAILVHSARRGIPELLESIEGLESFLSAESLVEQLAAAGVAAELHLVATEMDVTELLDADLARDLAARQLLGFCLETNLETCDPAVVHSAIETLRACSHSQDRRLVFPEDLGFILIRGTVDPVEDYFQIARDLNWGQLILDVPCSADGRARMLDLGCGTGRWLKVLAAVYPQFGAGEASHLQYSPLDPSAHAIGSVVVQVAQMFELDECLQVRAEQADLRDAHYGLIWSMHSLYGVEPIHLRTVMSKVQAALLPEGMAYLVMSDENSFYVRAAQEALGENLFRSAEEVCESLNGLGFSYEIRHLNYVERIHASSEMELRQYLWAESIGNSFLPESGAAGASAKLPALPTSDWWNSYRRGEYFEFPQNVQIILMRGGQGR